MIWSAVIIYQNDIVCDLLLFLELQVLNIDSLLNLLSPLHRRFHEVLSCAEFADCACFLEFPLESLESSLDVLTFLKRYNNHI